MTFALYYPSSSTYLGLGAGAAAEKPRPPSPQTPPPAYPGEHQGIPRPVERYNLTSKSWFCPRAPFRLDIPKTNHLAGFTEVSEPQQLSPLRERF